MSEAYILGVGTDKIDQPIAVSDDIDTLKAVRFTIRSGDFQVSNDDDSSWCDDWMEMDEWPDSLVWRSVDAVYKGQHLRIYRVPVVSKERP